jgi:hypothetical protein
MGNYSLKNHTHYGSRGGKVLGHGKKMLLSQVFVRNGYHARMKTLALFCLLALPTLAADTTILANSLVFMTATR